MNSYQFQHIVAVPFRSSPLIQVTRLY